MIKKYKQFNEGIRHLLIGPTEEEIITSGLGNYLKVMIKEKDIDGVQKAIDLGVDLNEKNTIYLYSAVIWGDIPIIKLLLENGIKYDVDIIYKSVSDKKFEILKVLEDHYHVNFITELKKKPIEYLRFGISENDKDIIIESIKLGADYKRSFNLYLCASMGVDIEIIKLFMFLGVGWDEDILKIRPVISNKDLLKLLLDYKYAKQIYTEYPIKESYVFPSEKEIDIFIKKITRS